MFPRRSDSTSGKDKQKKNITTIYTTIKPCPLKYPQDYPHCKLL